MATTPFPTTASGGWTAIGLVEVTGGGNGGGGNGGDGGGGGRDGKSREMGNGGVETVSADPVLLRQRLTAERRARHKCGADDRRHRTAPAEPLTANSKFSISFTKPP